MKMKSINKLLTAVLSASMLIGGTMPVLAAEDGAVDVEAPIYSLDIVNVIVPTSYAVAFNPDGLTVKTDDSTGTSTAQILSKNYGIINKSSKDKVITVKLNIKDQNDNSGITFVDSAQDVTDAAAGEYKIHLTAVPADTSEVKVGTASADKDTAATALNNVAMTGATGNAVTLKGGENYLGFKLDKAVWVPKAGSELTLGTTNSNDVSGNFEVDTLATGGKGITAFTFGGTMNTKADWSKLTKGIKISVVYGNETAASDLAAISGTGAMVELDIAPAFTSGNGVGQINYSAGTGDSGLKEIKKVALSGYDGYNAFSSGSVSWPAATDENGVITLSPQFLKNFKGESTEAAVTYETKGGETETATVDVWLVAPSIAPTFTAGGVGQIKYSAGMGNDGLKAIKKIEVTVGGTAYDGYNAYNSGSANWPAATDENGVVTFSSQFLALFKASTEAVVTYETNSGETRTFSLAVKLQ